MSVKKLLECVECAGMYSGFDVQQGQFFVTTMVCLDCYQRMQRAPYHVSCFGKPTVTTDGKVHHGYDADARECRLECPDRFICRVLVKRKIPAVAK